MTYMHIVPPLALFLAKQPQIDNFDLKSLRTLVSAAAPLGDKLTEEVEQRLDVDFLQGRYCFAFRKKSHGKYRFLSEAVKVKKKLVDFAQNVDCGCMLELPRICVWIRKVKKMYTYVHRSSTI